MHLWRRHFVSLDIETTGLDPEHDRIMEIGLVRFMNGGVVERKTFLVHPRRPVPDVVEKLTGISNSEAGSGVDIRAAMTTLRAFVRDASFLVAYNAAFDSSFLERTRLPTPTREQFLDPFLLSFVALPTVEDRKLSSIAARCGVAVALSHRAENDAEVAGAVFVSLAKTLELTTRAEGFGRLFDGLFLRAQRRELYLREQQLLLEKMENA